MSSRLFIIIIAAEGIVCNMRVVEFCLAEYRFVCFRVAAALFPPRQAVCIPSKDVCDCTAMLGKQVNKQGERKFLPLLPKVQHRWLLLFVKKGETHTKHASLQSLFFASVPEQSLEDSLVCLPHSTKLRKSLYSLLP